MANHFSDYSLANPDNLTKYKTASTISQKALEAVTGIAHLSDGISD